ncbi:MAG: hypothetical protein ICV83_24945 [Cytophagales bacterium]|nr:hypothetical protein [Cytophagales bacterium]
MKHFWCLSFAALLLASCAQEVKEPAVKKPAPPPAILINNSGSSTATITSSLSGARIVVDSPSEAGVVTYYNNSGCVRASFEAISFGSPMLVQITTRNCSVPGSSVYVPPFTWQSYNTGDLGLLGGALQFMVQANSSGSYGGGEIRNLYWY